MKKLYYIIFCLLCDGFWAANDHPKPEKITLTPVQIMYYINNETLYAIDLFILILRHVGFNLPLSLFLPRFCYIIHIIFAIKLRQYEISALPLFFMPLYLWDHYIIVCFYSALYIFCILRAFIDSRCDGNRPLGYKYMHGINHEYLLEYKSIEKLYWFILYQIIIVILFHFIANFAMLLVCVIFLYDQYFYKYLTTGKYSFYIYTVPLSCIALFVLRIYCNLQTLFIFYILLKLPLMVYLEECSIRQEQQLQKQQRQEQQQRQKMLSP